MGNESGIEKFVDIVIQWSLHSIRESQVELPLSRNYVCTDDNGLIVALLAKGAVLSFDIYAPKNHPWFDEPLEEDLVTQRNRISYSRN